MGNKEQLERIERLLAAVDGNAVSALSPSMLAPEIKLACKIAIKSLKAPRRSPRDKRKGVPYQEIADIFTAARDRHAGQKGRRFTASNLMVEGVNRWWGTGDPPIGLDEIRLVVDYKYGEWYGGERSVNWLGPQTLLGEKFEGYLAAATAAADSSEDHLKEIPDL